MTDELLLFERGFAEGWREAIRSIAMDLHQTTCDGEKFNGEGCTCLDYVTASADEGYEVLFNEEI